jgi:hemolysin D
MLLLGRYLEGSNGQSALLKTLSSEASDFAPGLLAIQESPPKRLPRAVLYAVAGLFVVLLAWAFFAKLDIVAVAEGQLVPQTYVKIVQPNDAGRVSEILIREGDTVKAGQVLMRLDPSVAQTDLGMLTSDSKAKQLALRRIDAELSGSPLLSRADDPPETFAQVLMQYRSHRQAYQEATAQEFSALEKARNDLVAGNEVLGKLRETVPIYKQAEAAHKKLVADGFIAEITMREKERDRIEKESELKTQMAVVAAIQNGIAMSEKKLAQVKSNYESQLLNERVELTNQLTKVKGEVAKQVVKSELLELRAPQAGVVKDLATSTVGTVVQPGQVLMTVVPKNEPLLAEVHLRNEDVGFIREGQSVKVKLAAYTFQKYGMLEGVVKLVGPDASAPQDQGQRIGSNAGQASGSAAPQSYRAIIKLDQQALRSPSGESLGLNSGMQVTAEIHQSQRTVLEYLLSPVQKVRQEAGRER